MDLEGSGKVSLPEADLPEWGVFAQMGHNEHVGRIDKVSMCGRAVVRVRKYRPKVEGESDEPFATVLCGPESMYGLQAVDEETCRNMHRLPTPKPQLPPAQTDPPAGEEYRAPDDDDDEEEDYEPDEPEEVLRARELLDRIGTVDFSHRVGTIEFDDVIPEGAIDKRVAELIQRYSSIHGVVSFVDDTIERFWLMGNVGMPAVTEEDHCNAVRFFGEVHPKLEQVARTFAMLRELTAAAKIGIRPAKAGQ